MFMLIYGNRNVTICVPEKLAAAGMVLEMALAKAIKTAMMPIPLQQVDEAGKQVPFQGLDMLTRAVAQAVVQKFPQAKQYNVYQIEQVLFDVMQRMGVKSDLMTNPAKKQELMSRIMTTLEGQRARESDPGINRPGWMQP